MQPVIIKRGSASTVYASLLNEGTNIIQDDARTETSLDILRSDSPRCIFNDSELKKMAFIKVSNYQMKAPSWRCVCNE